MPDRTKPTHILTIKVPLNLVDVGPFDYHPVELALREILAVSRLAADGVLCDDFAVSLTEAPDA